MNARPHPAVRNTARCVRCLKPAKFHTGHVVFGKRQIMAGWCSDRCLKVAGFCGQWTPAMSDAVNVVRKKASGK